MQTTEIMKKKLTTMILTAIIEEFFLEPEKLTINEMMQW